ncbi:MAG: hypothetical protein AAB250_16585 [Bdellovibrionota bacterium]
MEYQPFLPAQLDVMFPYVCFVYGAVMTFVLNLPQLVRLADEKLPAPLVAQWKGHTGLAAICMFVGAFWILQNLWLA